MHSDQLDHWNHFKRVVRPALDLAPETFLEDIAISLKQAGIQRAVARNNSMPIFDWLIGLIALQGVSDAVALGFSAKHGSVTWDEIQAELGSGGHCHRLRSYWHFSSCQYQKTARTCAEPHLLHSCSLPKHPLRNGRLNQAAYSLFLFIRDVCDGDLVSWIDCKLAEVDPGMGQPNRAAVMRDALLDPLTNIYGVGFKLWSMALADLLLCGDPNRERWASTGGSMIAIDSLVHGFLHRTGVLHRFGALHEIGPGCYAPGGCASLIEGLAGRIDARALNPDFPTFFPRFIQHSIWAFCAQGGFDICNGNRITDSTGCENRYCPAFDNCDRMSLRGGLK